MRRLLRCRRQAPVRQDVRGLNSDPMPGQFAHQIDEQRAPRGRHLIQHRGVEHDQRRGARRLSRQQRGEHRRWLPGPDVHASSGARSAFGRGQAWYFTRISQLSVRMERRSMPVTTTITPYGYRCEVISPLTAAEARGWFEDIKRIATKRRTYCQLIDL